MLSPGRSGTSTPALIGWNSTPSTLIGGRIGQSAIVIGREGWSPVVIGWSSQGVGQLVGADRGVVWHGEGGEPGLVGAAAQRLRVAGPAAQPRELLLTVGDHDITHGTAWHALHRPGVLEDALGRLLVDGAVERAGVGRQHQLQLTRRRLRVRRVLQNKS